MARRRFADTWWGSAWVEALESRARLDPNRLPRGRTYARQGRVWELELAPGEVRALVAGNRPQPYRVRVRIRTFDPDEWQRVLEAIAAKAGHAAALLDGELEPGIVDDARSVGVELLPDAGELVPRCSCPDWADPCKHSAAVCYLVASALDADPFDLLLLRGKPREAVLAELRRLRRGDTEPPPPDVAGRLKDPDPGMPAAEAWQRHPAPFPLPPPPPARLGVAAAWPTDPPTGAPFTADGLTALAEDAVERAWRMLRGEGTSGLGGDTDADLARRAAAALGTDRWDRLAARAGVPARRLVAWAVAWRHGGQGALGMLAEGRWRPDTRVMATARQALVEAGAPSGHIHVRDNTLTVGNVQLRLDQQGRWWRLEKRSGRWEVAAPPADEPDELWDEGG